MSSYKFPEKDILTAKEVWGLYNNGRGTETLKDLG